LDNKEIDMEQLKNPRHEMFAQELIATKGNLTASYGRVFPRATYKSCRQGGWLLSKNVNVQRRLRELMDQNGLGLSECIKKLKALTESEKLHHYRQGVPVMQPDNAARLQALHTAFKIHILLGDHGFLDSEGRG